MNNTNANTNTKFIRNKTYSTNKVIIIIGLLSVIFIIVYIYNNYTKIIASTLPTNTGSAIGATCPDYWDSIGNGKCQNTKKIGSCSKTDGADVMDFSSELFNNINIGNYAKCKWAKGCNVSWSGIDRTC